jgi:hypothetical protein
VPVARIPLEIADPDWKLVERRFDFLQAKDVRLFTLQKLLKLCLSGANAVHVPRRDLHPSTNHPPPTTNQNKV